MSGRDLEVFGFLCELTKGERDELDELLERRTAREGEIIFREGDEADGLVLILSGSVRLEAERCDTAEQLADGDHLGALSLVVVGARESTATADRECDLLLLDRMAFRRLVDDAPRAACRLAEAVIGELAGLLRRDLDQLAALHSPPGAAPQA